MATASYTTSRDTIHPCPKETMEETWSSGLTALHSKSPSPMKMVQGVNELGQQSVEQALAIVLEFPTTELQPEA